MIRVNSLLQEQLDLQKLKNNEELENLKQEFEDYRVAQEKVRQLDLFDRILLVIPLLLRNVRH